MEPRVSNIVEQMDVPNFDPNFEPQFRARSNTWPLRPRETIKSEDDNRSTPTGSDGGETVVENTDGYLAKDPGLKAKTSSRRNAWGNLSYADLITKAIESTTEKRLTLSQIYDWMVQNVPYFKDKGDTNSSAGWKNSIRHNLSLHSRFMRIQNEGTGKSSWWVINPDAKPGKSPRRRATSMDTKAYEKKRSRVKKKLDQLRALGVDHSPKESDFGDGELTQGVDHFNLSSQDFRARTSSNASSLGGRLSPIQSMYEPDLHDCQVPPMSPIPWNQTSSYSNAEGFAETLSESLAEMFVGDALSPGCSAELGTSSLSTPSPLQPHSSPTGYLPALPPYSDARQASPQQLSPNQNFKDSGLNQHIGQRIPQMNNMGHIGIQSTSQDIFLEDPSTSEMLKNLLQDGSPQNMSPDPPKYSMPTKSYQNNGGDGLMATGNDSDINNSLLRQALTEKQQLVRSQLQAALQNQHHRQQLQNRLKQLQQQQIRRQMHQRLQMQLQQQQMLQQQQYQSMQQQSAMVTDYMPQSNNAAAASAPVDVAGCLLADSSTDIDLDFSLPVDLDLVTIVEQNTEDLDCNVDEIISHELSMDGLLDFNFEGNGNSSGDTVQT